MPRGPLAVLRILPRRLAVLASLLALLALPAVAQATEEQTTINFDGLSPGVRVTNQYEGQGLVFGEAEEYGFIKPASKFGFEQDELSEYPGGCGAPTVESELSTISPPNVARIVCGGAGGTFAVLMNFGKKISAYVGDSGHPFESETYKLDAYNYEKQLIGRSQVDTTMASVTNPISFEAPNKAYEIAYFTIYRTKPFSFFEEMEDRVLMM